MDAWLEARVPAEREKKLGYRSIFIFPTLAGFVFLGLLAIILLAAINYQNNMLYAFVFLLGAVFAVSIFHCYRNLSGLKVAFRHAPDCFVGEVGVFHYFLTQSHGAETYALTLQWPNQGPATHIPQVTSMSQESVVYCVIERRGLIKPGRLLVQSSYPLGLIRAWSWLDLQASIIAFPLPLKAPAAHSINDGGGEGKGRHISGNEDYEGLRSYQPGDSPRQIDWKHYAQKGSLYTKKFSDVVGEDLWLDLRDYPVGSIEEKLSWLCYRVLELSALQARYGLQLGDLRIEVDSGEEHRLQCLRALALYQSGGLKAEEFSG